MCGIWAHLKRTKGGAFVTPPRNQMLHRGPDFFGIKEVGETHLLAHSRLHIVGVPGPQPLVDAQGHVLTINGEIYNHRDLALGTNAKDQQSDCDVVLHVLQDLDPQHLHRLDGVFAFVLACPDGRFLVARDRIGVNPLYYCVLSDDSILVASERKMLTGSGRRIMAFPPGCAMTDRDTDPRRWYYPIDTPPTLVPDLAKIQTLMERAVEKRLMTDQPFGCLLSGGLDSTIVATIASNLLKERGIVLKTFAVGLRGSPDLAAARAVADHLCTKHYEIVFTLDQALSMVEETVRSVESVDITTIRASTAMMLLAQGIKNVAPDIKMVLSGEGADETWMGYLFWHHAPNPTTAHEESVRKLYALHRFDCQRANKSMMRFGLETRVPFLDQDVLDYVMQIDPSYRIPGGPAPRIEKYLLRTAFASGRHKVLESVCWRQKEQFSDGVGHALINALRQKGSPSSLPAFAHPPATDEQGFYMSLFAKHFSSDCCANVPCEPWPIPWQPNKDPSGRANQVHARFVQTHRLSKSKRG